MTGQKSGDETRTDAIDSSTLRSDTAFSLKMIAEKRMGGAINLRGINFQLLYSLFLILSKLKDSGSSVKVRLEGIEDVDCYIEDKTELIQVKTSQNIIDAGAFWELKVLQHFLEVHKIRPTICFVIAFNAPIARGHLQNIQQKNIAPSTIDFWHNKFQQSNIEISKLQLEDFLKLISFQQDTEQDLINKINEILFISYGINIGSATAFYQGLFYWVFETARKRETITCKELSATLLSIIDSFSKFPENPAAQNNWIVPVKFDSPNDTSGEAYFDGKAARPEDIVNGFPVKRILWEKQIEKSIEDYDISIVKSSSGQGKSTLAWQIGFNLLKKSFSIYQLHQCLNYNEANAIHDFIETRLRAGQIPLIILDGISHRHSAWDELAQLLNAKPVKILITTREEDWIRFGGIIPGVVSNTVNIALTEQEASLIYEELVKRKKTHFSINSWQPAWEKVSAKGLMVEYIYLLTRGQLIADRLSQQVKKMKDEQGGAAKLEILRLIAVADVMNLQLSTSKLSAHIAENIGFNTDKNEAFRELEKEYYLRFEYNYVAGLHPVRSEHLVNILHSHFPVQSTLLSILTILDEAYIYDYFIEAPLRFEAIHWDEYFKEAASIMAERPFTQMVYAIDGLMHLEPYQFWIRNKAIFDSIHSTGGLDLFIFETAPFNELKTLESLSATLPGEEGSNIRHLLHCLTQLTPYSILKSSIYKFTQNLKAAIAGKNKYSNPEGITFLYKWFKRLGIEFPPIIQINEQELLEYLKTKEIGDSSDLFHFYSIQQPEQYKLFIESNKAYIIGWLKKKTNTLTITIDNDEVYIEYLLDSNTDRANEYSVFRINIIHAVFPFFKCYHTIAIILPFPSADLYKAVVQNSTKALTPAALFDEFDIHINQIWSKTIIDQYSANSVYEWQSKLGELRAIAVTLAKYCTRLLEAALKLNEQKRKSLIRDMVPIIKDYYQAEFRLPKYPIQSKKYFEKSDFELKLKIINNWQTSFRNFLNQLSGLINPVSEKDMRLPLINISAALYRLPKMQKAYEDIVEKTYRYFPDSTLCENELTWQTRLLHTVEFYVHRNAYGQTEKVVVAKREVEQWKEESDIKRLRQLTDIIQSFANNSHFAFYIPDKIIEEENLKYAVIGVINLNAEDENELLEFSVGLTDLLSTGIHFFTFVLINEQHEAVSAFRVGSHYFEKLQNFVLTGELEMDDFGNPLIQFPDEDMLQTLKGVKLKPPMTIPENESFFRMMMNVWKLCEHRRRLNTVALPEREWLQEVETEYSKYIRQEATQCLTPSSKPINRDYIDNVLNNKENPQPEEVSNIMMQKAIMIQNP